MNLSRYQLDVAASGLHQAIELARILHARRRPELEQVLQQLQDMLLVTCDRESETGSVAEQSKVNNPIGTTEVAELLHCSPQRVRQIKNDLDCELCPCGAGWVFDRQTVLDYAEGRKR